MRSLSLFITSPKGAHHPLAIPFTAHCAPKGSATRSCDPFHCSLSLQRERNTLLRPLSLLIAPPKGVQHALATPFTTHCAPKGGATRSCVTFHCSLRPQRGCNTLLRSLSLLIASPKGAHHAFAFPFTTPKFYIVAEDKVLSSSYRKDVVGPSLASFDFNEVRIDFQPVLVLKKRDGETALEKRL